MFELIPSEIVGCHEIQPRVFDDARGRFVKVFHKEAFEKLGLETDFSEDYYSLSRRNVIRGMHFQFPPKEHAKLVYCVQGGVFDAVLDLRVGSPTYGRSASFILDADKANCIYIPKGVAHGFCATSDSATLVYKVSSVYSPEHDSGILWDSLDIEWPTISPLVSERDRGFVAFADFVSPFLYE